jgi:hypothetical protein
LLKFLLKEARVQQRQQRGYFFLLGALFLLPFSTFLPPPLIYRINVAGHDAPFSSIRSFNWPALQHGILKRGAKSSIQVQEYTKEQC